MIADSYRNPFSGINASQLDDDSILEYWCNPFNYKFLSQIQETDIYNDPLNIVIVGGRYSGKTMLLRYCSFNIQYSIANKLSNNNNIVNYFINKGGIGFYNRIDGSVLIDFNKKNLPEEKRTALFIHYFELHIGYEYLNAINTLVRNNHIKINQNFITEISKLLGNQDLDSLDACLTFLDNEIKEIDNYRSKIPFYEHFDLNIKLYASTTLIYRIPEIISNNIDEFQKTNFIIFIDEFENFAESQQRVINTLLKFTKPNIKFRLSMRPEGFNTNKTVSDEDVIQEGREYRSINLDNVILMNMDYNKFIIEVCKKRLESVKVFKENNNTNIVSYLGVRENLEDEAINITKNKSGRHFNLKKYKKYDKVELNKLKYPQNPLLEMLNLLWLSRGKKIETIYCAFHDYLNGIINENSKKYKRDYIDKYKLSLMFLLTSVYKKDKLYYSFRTYSFLSSGMVGHFLELCNEAFKFAAFNDKEKLINEGKISREIQSKAAYEVSKYQLKKTSGTPYYGHLIYQFVNNLGKIFQYFHLDPKIKYPETNQFTVDYRLNKDKECQEAFRHAIRWSIILEKKSKQRPSPSKNKTDIFTINRIFSPTFGISYRTRGGYSYEIIPDDLIKFMNEKIEPSKEINKLIKNIKKEKMNKKISLNQPELGLFK